MVVKFVPVNVIVLSPLLYVAAVIVVDDAAPVAAAVEVDVLVVEVPYRHRVAVIGTLWMLGVESDKIELGLNSE